METNFLYIQTSLVHKKKAVVSFSVQSCYQEIQKELFALFSQFNAALVLVKGKMPDWQPNKMRKMQVSLKDLYTYNTDRWDVLN